MAKKICCLKDSKASTNLRHLKTDESFGIVTWKHIGGFQHKTGYWGSREEFEWLKWVFTFCCRILVAKTQINSFERAGESFWQPNVPQLGEKLLLTIEAIEFQVQVESTESIRNEWIPGCETDSVITRKTPLIRLLAGQGTNSAK